MNNIIFDLDGTLIDSSNGIINSFNEASKLSGLQEIKKNIIKENIGPSLDKLINILYPTITIETKNQIFSNFIESYDNKYCLKYKLLFKKSSLIKLKKNNHLGIITNKRSLPTKKILKDANIDKFFNFVICSDTFSIKNTKKLNYLSIHNVYPEFNNKLKTFYVGDTISDLNFSNEMGLSFFGVEFSEKLPQGNFQILKSIDELVKIF